MYGMYLRTITEPTARSRGASTGSTTVPSALAPPPVHVQVLPPAREHPNPESMAMLHSLEHVV